MDEPARHPPTIAVHADDPLVAAGIRSLLHPNGVHRLVPVGFAGDVDAIVVDGSVDDLVGTMKELCGRHAGARFVVLAGEGWPMDLFAAAESGLAAVIPRDQTDGARLRRAIATVLAGGGDLPAGMQARLLEEMARVQREVLQPRGLAASGLARREVDVLRLLATGLDIREIATELCYSERTVKNILHILMARLQLRNRAHAVAFAVRRGLI